MISPFKWDYPIIHILPEILFPLLDSPVPILIGFSEEFDPYLI